ncbi:hypothetical protein ACEWY4_017409 [Coilia grayii]|uniref:Reverse transcriptase domain-containing protein n=1 Tax=Coilia grayii TaxID=363190 RepID=A0ABD1JI75_9TELE
MKKSATLQTHGNYFQPSNHCLTPPPPAATDLNPDNFATFFTEKIANISKQFCDSPSSAENSPQVTTCTAGTLREFTSLSEGDISKLIAESRPTTCPLDPVPTSLLRDIAPTVVPAITFIMNSSLSSATVPSAFKQARITPLLKKPTLNPAQVENHRPVSLLPFLSKTLERPVAKQVTNFLNQNGQLDPKQSGFRSGHSTETVLLSGTEALRTARAKGPSSVLILLDLSAAFHTVNHKILLTILTSMGITGAVHFWFNSYLTGRSFKVSWQGKLSSNYTLTTGVPQGSVLGPLLFAMYTISLGHVIRTHGLSYHCYADDTQMYLLFQPDDSTVSARISSQHAAQLLVQAMVIARLDYCNALLAGLSACAIKPLQMVQNAAARLVFTQPKRAHVTPLYIQLHWLPVAAQIKHKALTLAYKTISGSAPAYLKEMLRPYVPGRELRSFNTNRLAVPPARSKRHQAKLFSVIVPQWWNKLPEATRLASSLSTFKKHVKPLPQLLTALMPELAQTRD